MFTIKICGITRPDDARAGAEAGADAIGLNFYRESVRAIDLELARAIIAELPTEIIKVGLFVNAAPSEICRTYDALGLNLIQLHGDEPPEQLAALDGRPVMKAFRAAGAEGLRTVASYLETCRTLGCPPQMIILDAPLARGFGGSGNLADWSLAKEYQESFRTPPLVLAGGLKAENVADAIRATGAGAVDTASGVESQPGIKDPAAIKAFVFAARQALVPGH
ncbi:MAG: phosphoribosylanthranilate isomerase [Thermoguttaceae bacterium]|jgi:phosphoribosylanthranilate isomerase